MALMSVNIGSQHTVWRVHPAVRIRHQVTLTLRFPATCRWTPRGTQVLWIHREEGI